MKKLYMTVCVLLWIGLATVVFAAPPDAGPPGPHGFQESHGHEALHKIGSVLKLSQEQREKMREIRERFWADTHDLRYDIREKRIEMRKLFTDP